MPVSLEEPGATCNNPRPTVAVAAAIHSPSKTIASPKPCMDCSTFSGSPAHEPRTHPLKNPRGMASQEHRSGRRYKPTFKALEGQLQKESLSFE